MFRLFLGINWLEFIELSSKSCSKIGMHIALASSVRPEILLTVLQQQVARIYSHYQEKLCLLVTCSSKCQLIPFHLNLGSVYFSATIDIDSLIRNVNKCFYMYIRYNFSHSKFVLLINCRGDWANAHCTKILKRTFKVYFVEIRQQKNEISS